jgi:hypothetical protein
LITGFPVEKGMRDLRRSAKKDTKGKKRSNSKLEEQEVDRREFIERSARDIGACGFAIYEIVKTIRTEIIQEVVDDIKDSVRRF